VQNTKRNSRKFRDFTFLCVQNRKEGLKKIEKRVIYKKLKL
jgi:hypothetical protein